MAVAPQYQADVESILAARHDNGADFWATPDGRLSKGGPFSTLTGAVHVSAGQALYGEWAGL